MYNHLGYSICYDVNTKLVRCCYYILLGKFDSVTTVGDNLPHSSGIGHIQTGVNLGTYPLFLTPDSNREGVANY